MRRLFVSDNARLAASFLMLTVVAFGAMCLVYDVQAFAQALEPPADPTGVDFAPVALTLIEAAAAALMTASTVVAGFLVRFLMGRIGMQDSAAEHLAATRLDEIIRLGIDHAEGWAKTQVADPASSIRSVKFDNIFMRMAARYIRDSAPGLLKQFNISEERLHEMILTRLNRIMGTPRVDSGSAEPVVGHGEG